MRIQGENHTTLFYLVQFLRDKTSMLEILGVNVRVERIDTSQTSMMKDSTNPILAQRSHTSLLVISSQFEGPLVPAEPTSIERVDVGIGIDFNIRKKREDSKISTQEEGTPTISTLILASTSKLIGISALPPHPSTTTTDTGIVFVLCEFFQSIIDNQSVTTI